MTKIDLAGTWTLSCDKPNFQAPALGDIKLIPVQMQEAGPFGKNGRNIHGMIFRCKRSAQ